MSQVIGHGTTNNDVGNMQKAERSAARAACHWRPAMLAIHAGSGCDHNEAAFLTSAHGNSQYIKGSGNPISSSTNPHFLVYPLLSLYI